MGLSQALNGSLHVGAGQNLPTRTIAPTFQASAKWLGDVVNVKPEKKNRKGWNHMSGQVNSWKQ